MIRVILCALVLLCAHPALAAVPPYPAATTPLTGNELLICFQGGVTKTCTTGQSGAVNPVNIPPVANATMGETYLLEPSGVSNPLAGIGAIFPGGTTGCFLCVGQTFTAGNTTGGVNGPYATEWIHAGDTVSSNLNIVALGADCKALVSSSTCVAQNNIAWSLPGLTNVNLNAAEYDCEPGAGTTLDSRSACLLSVAFSAAFPYAFHAAGDASSSGSFLVEVGCGVQITGACFSADTGASATNFANSANGTWTVAYELGTGITQGIEFGTGGGGVSPFVYGDGSGNELVQLGTGNQWAVKNSSGVTKFTVDAGVGSISATGFVRPGQTLFAALGTADPSPQVGDHLNITDASACTFGTQITAGSGSGHSCPGVYNGVGWFPEVTH